MMSFANLRDPATLQRSPMLTKLVYGPILKGSRPEKKKHFENVLKTYMATGDRRNTMFHAKGKKVLCHRPSDEPRDTTWTRDPHLRPHRYSNCIVAATFTTRTLLKEEIFQGFKMQISLKG